jgi:hypothetical protein
MKGKLFTKQIIQQTENFVSRRWKQDISSVRVLAFAVITLTVIMFRLWISFSHNLILGIDGGYYPLQVRSILNTGFLSFKDVPLYFYFCAFVVKFISTMGFTVTNEMIISVIKVIDSTALPLLAIPLFKILSRNEHSIPFFAELAILIFSVLSFTPFIILGDLQKNAFVIPLVFIFVLFYENYLIIPNKRNLITVVILLAILAISHFGVFTFCLAFLILSLLIIYRKKAILPSAIAISVGFGMIALFDINRAFRLITFWNVIFERPALFQGPLPLPLLLNILFSYFLVMIGIFYYRRYKDKTDKVTEYMVLSFIALIFIFALPIYEIQYVQRFNVLLLIPQGLLIFYLVRMNQKYAVPVSISLVLLTIASFFMYVKEDKKPCLDDLAFQDLQNIKRYISDNSESTIVITRIGTEFWTAWALDVKVGNERAMDKLALDKYRNIILLQQKSEDRSGPLKSKANHNPKISNDGTYPMEPPHIPPIPENFKLIYSSPYFNAYQKLN